MPMVSGTDGLEQGLHRGELLPPKDLADSLDLLDGKRGEIGQGALLDLPPFPIRYVFTRRSTSMTGGFGSFSRYPPTIAFMPRTRRFTPSRTASLARFPYEMRR